MKSFQNRKLIVDENLNDETQLNKLRKMRAKICFPIINRGKIWYDRLTSSQIAELDLWYNDWLNVTKTNQIPAYPAWLNEPVPEGDDVL